MREDGWLLPDTDDPVVRPFWEGCARGELLVQACGDCGRPRMPPREMCPTCRSFAVRWKQASGRGTIWSFVVAHPPLLPAYAEQAPYNVVVVELDDIPGIRLVGNVLAAPAARLDSVDPHTITIGDSVTVVFSAVSDGILLPQWVLGC